MEPAILEVTEVIQKVDDPMMALYMIVVAYLFKIVTYAGKHIANDEPGAKGMIGKVCRAIMLYTPNKEKRNQ